MKLLLLKIFIDNEKTNIPDQTTDELETDIEVVTIENNVVNDVDESDNDETIQIEDLTTLSPLTTPAVIDKAIDSLPGLIEDTPSDNETSDQKFEHFTESVSKKAVTLASKIERLKKKKILNSKKARKPSVAVRHRKTGLSRETVSGGNGVNTERHRQRISKDDRHKAWQRRARSRFG